MQAWVVPAPLEAARCGVLRAGKCSVFTRSTLSVRGGRRAYLWTALVDDEPPKPFDPTGDDGKRSNGEGGDGAKSGGDRDWDASWKTFKDEDARGGVFRLPPESAAPVADKRTERLTDVWSNDSGFLAGIAVIVGIGLFYGYVYASGGLTR